MLTERALMFIPPPSHGADAGRGWKKQAPTVHVRLVRQEMKPPTESKHGVAGGRAGDKPPPFDTLS